MINVNKNEIQRYLGYRGVTEIDAQISAMIDDCIMEMSSQVAPKSIFRSYPLEIGPDSIDFADIHVTSKNLLKNIKGCKEIVMMAATIGLGPDMLVRRTEVRDIMRAYVYQATGAAMVEAYCDEVNEKIKEEAAARGLYARPRFSPGYGDFPLEVQKDFVRILDMPKTIGVTLSDSLLMTPTKSVTAVIGLAPTDEGCNLAGCEECTMHDTCAYSR
ncbi:MAG: Vitamin B12 dependent methionine synthase activation subunit [Eubacterium sp.]|nr:Vitamin B12 dependent methionine synthase activation subunit [Eubacterium sp.]